MNVLSYSTLVAWKDIIIMKKPVLIITQMFQKFVIQNIKIKNIIIFSIKNNSNFKC